MKKYAAFVDSRSQKDYKASMGRFASIPMLVNAVVSIAGESGELTDALKKHIFYGKPLDIENIKEELGDILFYLTMAANSLNISLNELSKLNMDKLKKRYPKNFNPKDAIQRKDKKDA